MKRITLTAGRSGGRLLVLMRSSGLCEELDDGSVRIAMFDTGKLFGLSRNVAAILRTDVWVKMEDSGTYLFTLRNPMIEPHKEFIRQNWYCEFYHSKTG